MPDMAPEMDLDVPPPPSALDRVQAWLTASGFVVPALTDLDESMLPEPVRRLLAHTGGMTAALEAHWAEPMGLEVLSTQQAGDRVSRAVLLRGGYSGVAAEIGLIAIELAPLPEPLRGQVAQGTVPFGALLARSGIAFRSEPDLYMMLQADLPLALLLDVPQGTRLHARHTVLTATDGTRLAEAVEILTSRVPG
ncbi:MAG TPA: hypothetical protein VED40_07485 [Azospirillaceae bacterium]|nr:hypothetical protein [Azospirillaceae bacterium]